MKTIDLRPMGFSPSAEELEALNEKIDHTYCLFIDRVADALNCDDAKAMGLLLILYDQGLGEVYIMVWHQSKASGCHALSKRDILAGFPNLPGPCSCCGEEISDPDALVYDIWIEFKEPVQFVVSPAGVGPWAKWREKLRLVIKEGKK